MYYSVPNLKPDFSNRLEVDQAHIRNKCIELGFLQPNKGNNMNEITTTVTNAPFDLDTMVEILDAEGNPTGQYRARTSEDAQPGATVYTTAEDGEVEVIVH